MKIDYKKVLRGTLLIGAFAYLSPLLVTMALGIFGLGGTDIAARVAITVLPVIMGVAAYLVTRSDDLPENTKEKAQYFAGVVITLFLFDVIIMKYLLPLRSIIESWEGQIGYALVIIIFGISLWHGRGKKKK